MPHGSGHLLSDDIVAAAHADVPLINAGDGGHRFGAADGLGQYGCHVEAVRCVDVAR